MPELELPEREAVEDSTQSAEDEAVEVSVAGTTATVSLPADATAVEAAAVSAAIGAHLTDRQQAAAAATADAADSTERIDAWVLADRLRSRGKRRWPRDVERGHEWRAAARSF